jgi:nucleoside 2-deoxyribosyltransferase
VTKPRVYVAGAMTGLPEFNFPAFHRAAKLLRDMGFPVENPAENPEPAAPTWENYLRTALRQMLTCDAVVLLPGWESSKGANLERDVALRLSMPVWTLADFIEAYSA